MKQQAPEQSPEPVLYIYQWFEKCSYFFESRGCCHSEKMGFPLPP